MLGRSLFIKKKKKLLANSFVVVKWSEVRGLIWSDLSLGVVKRFVLVRYFESFIYDNDSTQPDSTRLGDQNHSKEQSWCFFITQRRRRRDKYSYSMFASNCLFFYFWSLHDVRCVRSWKVFRYTRPGPARHDTTRTRRDPADRNRCVTGRRSISISSRGKVLLGKASHQTEVYNLISQFMMLIRIG